MHPNASPDEGMECPDAYGGKVMWTDALKLQLTALMKILSEEPEPVKNWVQDSAVLLICYP